MGKFSTLIRQFIRYFFVGGAAALVEWSVFFACNKILRIDYRLAVVLSFVIATAVNLLLGKKFVFKGQKLNKLAETTAIYLVSAAGLLVNLICMYIFVDLLHLEAMLSKIISTGIAFVWNFSSRRWLVYRKSN